MRPVDALVISTGRAASTAIYRYLDQFGALGLPANKEPHFWADVERYGGRYPLLDDIHVSDPQQYEALYANARKVIDASVGYFFCIDAVIERLLNAGQHPKIVFLYREPVARAESMYNEVRRKGLEQADTVLDAVTAPKPAGLWWEHYYDNVACDSVYARLREHFPVLAVNFEAIRGNPEAALRRVAGFLDIPEAGEVSYVPVNSSTEHAVHRRLRPLRFIGRLLPDALQNAILGQISRIMHRSTQRDDGLAAHLPKSISEFTALRKRLRSEDIHDSRD